MSFSSDGILYFGVDYGEEPQVPWKFYDPEGEEAEEEYDDEEDWYCTLMGTGNTNDLWAEFYAWKETPEGEAEFEKLKAAPGWKELYTVYEELYPEWREKLSAVYDERATVKKTMPFEFVHHCSYDYPMYGLAVPGSLVRAYRGGPVQVDLPAMNVALVGARQLTEAFCEKYGIPFNDPQWILTSMMG